MSTTFVKPQQQSVRWYHASAKDQVLGRLAVRIARILQGKHLVDYTPHVDQGDHVVITDAEAVRLTGTKEQRKVYHSHSGYVGGLKTVPFQRMRERRPEEVVRLAVRRMLPKGRLGRDMARKLRVYRGAAHPHQAQKPAPLPE